MSSGALFCVGVACVRNEADVVEMWARYNLQLLDELHVVDNLSVDSTGWVLAQLQAEGLTLFVHRCDDPSHPQAQRMNDLARQLARRPEVDFLVPLDADELLALPSRAALHEALASLPVAHAGAMVWRTYLPEPIQDAAPGAGDGAEPTQVFFRRMTRYRSLENRRLSKLILPAKLFLSYEWSEGSHNALHHQTGEPVQRVDLPFKLAHFPVRHAEQLARKVLVGAQAVLRKAKRGRREFWHWLKLAQQLSEAEALGQTLDLQRIALTYSLGDEVLTQQAVLHGAVPDFPALKQCYPVPELTRAEVTALLTDPPSVDDLWRQLATTPTWAQPWLALARLYKASGLAWQALYTARQAVRLNANLKSQVHALALEPLDKEVQSDALLGRANLPEAAALAERFALQLKACPGDWLSWLYAARLYEMDSAAASELAPHALQQAQSLEPLVGESLHWLGVWRLNAGNAPDAIQALSGLLTIRPVRFGSMMVLGEALLRNGQNEAAEKAFARASLSDNPDFLQTLSARVFQHNYWKEAIEVLNKALSLRPGSVSVLLALAKIHWEVFQLSQAQEHCRQVLAIDPLNQEVGYMLAALPGRMGDAKGHFDAVQAKHASGSEPGSRLASSVAMASLYLDSMSANAVADLHRELCAPIEAGLASSALAHFQPRTALIDAGQPKRRLRVGWVTGDLHRQHPVNIFMLPLLQQLNPQRLEVFIYHTGTMHDAYTRLAQGSAEHWVEAATLDDVALKQAIEADQIDVLVDLAGHTTNQRLRVFAMRAAPVQASFLGYPHSTGLSHIDWLVGDAVVSPAKHAHLFSEGTAQLPGSVFCWAPVDDYPLPIARPAAAPVVFGSFNNAMKLSPQTVALWARVLQAVPGSRLLLKAPSLRDASVQTRFAALFAAQGIEAQRLTFRGPSGLLDMMQEYGDVDIALDPSPYNGGTTTLQALWMGVPVLTLEGKNFVSRMGASFMHTLGRPQWVAQGESAFVAAAVSLAADVQALRLQRSDLRAAMVASPLCDICNYARHFEALLARMWTNHTEKTGLRLLPASPALLFPRKP